MLGLMARRRRLSRSLVRLLLLAALTSCSRNVEGELSASVCDNKLDDDDDGLRDCDDPDCWVFCPPRNAPSSDAPRSSIQRPRPTPPAGARRRQTNMSSEMTPKLRPERNTPAPEQLRLCAGREATTESATARRHRGNYRSTSARLSCRCITRASVVTTTTTLAVPRACRRYVSASDPIRTWSCC